MLISGLASVGELTFSSAILSVYLVCVFSYGVKYSELVSCRILVSLMESTGIIQLE